MFGVNALRLFSFRVPRGPGCEGGIKFSYKKPSRLARYLNMVPYGLTTYDTEERR